MRKIFLSSLPLGCLPLLSAPKILPVRLSPKRKFLRFYLIFIILISSKKDPDIIPRIVSTLAILLKDHAVQVQKRVIQSANQIYKLTLNWLAKARTTTEEMITTWNTISTIKTQIIKMIDSDNDG